MSLGSGIKQVLRWPGILQVLPDWSPVILTQQPEWPIRDVIRIVLLLCSKHCNKDTLETGNNGCIQEGNIRVEGRAQGWKEGLHLLCTLFAPYEFSCHIHVLPIWLNHFNSEFLFAMNFFSFLRAIHISIWIMSSQKFGMLFFSIENDKLYNYFLSKLGYQE